MATHSGASRRRMLAFGILKCETSRAGPAIGRSGAPAAAERAARTAALPHRASRADQLAHPATVGRDAAAIRPALGEPALHHRLAIAARIDRPARTFLSFDPRNSGSRGGERQHGNHRQAAHGNAPRLRIGSSRNTRTDRGAMQPATPPVTALHQQMSGAVPPVQRRPARVRGGTWRPQTTLPTPRRRARGSPPPCSR